ncbi:unnamed protein product, partial [Heterosigma akashiwo]
MASPKDDITLNRVDGHDVEFALNWDFFEGMPQVDLDAQAVMFDATGKVVDAAFFNQLSACDGSITHSGDNRDGVGEDDEVIKVDFDRLPQFVKAIAIVVTAYSGGTFQAVETANLQVRSPSADPPVLAEVSIGCQGSNTAFVFCVVYATR